MSQICSLGDLKPIKIQRRINEKLSQNTSLKDSEGNALTFFEGLLSQELSDDEKSNLLADLFSGYFVKGSLNTELEVNKVCNIIVNFLKFNKKILIKENKLNEVFKNRFYAEKEIKSDPENKDSERHDEAIEKTVNETIDKTYSDLLKSLFGKTPSALTSIPAKFKININRRLFVNLDETSQNSLEDHSYLCAIDELSFNKNIAQYQSELFKTIASFLNSRGYNVSEELYLGQQDLTLNGNYREIMEKAYEYIENKIKNGTHDDTILQGWGSIKIAKSSFGKLSSGYNDESAQYYEFVEAWINLKYFDDTVRKVYGDTITIKNKGYWNILFPVIQRGVKGKYSLGIDKKSRTSGYTDENKRNGFTEAGRFSVALLTSQPLYSYNNWILNNKNRQAAKSEEENMNQIHITVAFSKLLKMVLNKEISSVGSNSSEKDKIINSLNKLFIDAVLLLHNNPKKHISTILRLLFDTNSDNIINKVKEKLTEKELNNLFSLWITVYNVNEKYGGSICLLENVHPKKQIINKKEGLVYSDCISGLVDRVDEVNYLSIPYDDKKSNILIQFRKKFYGDNRIFKLVEETNNNINTLKESQRKDLQDKYLIYQEGNSFIIKLNGFDLVINPNDKENTKKDKEITYNIFNSTKNTVSIRKKDSSKLELIDKYFKDIVFTERESLIKIKDEKSEIHKLLELFKDTLNYDFLSDTSLQILHLYKSSHSHSIFSELTEGSLRALINNNIYSKNKNDESIPELVLSDTSEYAYLFKNSGKIINGKFQPENKLKLFEEQGTKWFLNTCNESDLWTTHLSEAELEFSGDLPSAISRNFSGNAELNGRTGHLGSHFHYLMRKISLMGEQDPNNPVATGELLGAGKIDDLYRGMTIMSDIRALDKITIKSAKDLNEKELIFTNIFHNFFGLYSQENELKGNVAFLPTTYADKSTIELFMFTANENLSGTNNNLMNLSESDVETYLMNTAGNYYYKVIIKVIKDYNKMLGTNFDETDYRSLIKINKYLHDNIENEFELFQKAKEANIEIARNLHFSIFRGKLGISPILYNYGEIFSSKKNLKSYILKQKSLFIKDLYDIGGEVGVPTDDPFVLNAISLALATDELKKKWIDRGYLVIEKDGELNPIFEKYFLAFSAVTPSMRILLSGSEIAHPLNKTEVYNSKNNKIIDLLNLAGVTFEDLGYEDDAKNSSENIISIKQRIDNIKSPKKKKTALEVYSNIMLELQGIAGAEGLVSKRNVQIPGTLQYVTLNALNSIPRKVRVAIIDDIKALVNTFNGQKDKLDVHDGAALINPFFSILENMGLQDQAVNLDKKPIWHSYDPTTGTATLFKYATFTITNLRMMLSLKSDVSLNNLFKKMTNEQWRLKGDSWDSSSWSNRTGCKIDLINGKKFGLTKVENDQFVISTKIDFKKDIRQGKNLIYGINGLYYLILDFGYEKVDEKVGQPVYYTIELKVSIDGKVLGGLVKVYHIFDENSNHIKTSNLTPEIIDGLRGMKKYHTINSLYELHNALGGVLCVEKKDGEFIPSEFNNRCIVNYMNLVGDPRRPHLSNISGLNGGRSESILTQEEYYLPLKHLMISMAGNSTSCKSELKNVNPRSRWADNKELTTCEVNTDGYGIQQDSDHSADEAELTEPSLVMTALSQGGSLHKYARQIYQSLGRVSLVAAKVEIDAVTDFLNSQKENPNRDENINKLYDIVGRIIINNLNSSFSEVDLSSEMIDEIRKEFGINSDNHLLDKLKIAFSDPNLFGHIFPTIITVINSKGIRRKNPGNGMVMAPGYNIYQLFDDDGIRVTLPELVRRRINVGLVVTEHVKGLKYDSIAEGANCLTAQNILNKIDEYLKLKQLQVSAFDYNKFDLGDRVNIIGGIYDETKNYPSIYIDSIDKFYAIEDKNWLNLSENKQVRLVATSVGILNIHEFLSKHGLSGFLEECKRRGYNNTIILENIANDEMLNLYNQTELSYLLDITKPTDLRPTRVSFLDESGKRKSIYTIPIIRKSFQEKGLEINPKLMKVISSNLKNGYYYDNYLEDTSRGYLTYIPDPSLQKHIISDLKYEKAEAIVSNMLATRFNTTVYKTILQIEQEGLFNKESFKESLEEYPLNKFEIRFLKANGQHTYITLDKIDVKSDRTKNVIFSPEHVETRRLKNDNINGLENYSIIRLNPDYSDFMEVAKYVEMKDLTTVQTSEGKDQVVTLDGKVLTNQKEYIIIDKKVFKIFNLVKSFNTIISDSEKKVTEHLTYSINQNTIKEMSDLLKLKDYLIISNILNKLYSKDSYIAFDLRIQNTDLVKRSFNIFKDIKKNHSSLNNYIDAISDNSLKRIDLEFDKILDNYSKLLKTSFYKSLEIIASRIPSQTLLSFMSMNIVGFTQMETNVTYVSHIQTFLQGSDYDIDKSYMISYFFDDNGRFIIWSNLMKLDSIDNLNESTKLPIPNKVLILSASELSNFTSNVNLNRINNTLSKSNLKLETRIEKEKEKARIRENDNLIAKPIDITKELLEIIASPSISNYANLIDKLDQNAVEGYLRKDEKSKYSYELKFYVFYTYDSSLDLTIVNKILLEIQEHENYEIPENLKEKALLNANTSKIHIIISDIENLNSANTPIAMNMARGAASRSEGKTKHMTFFNPMTVFKMQRENQIGKNVIGIAANGEKAFFTLYYYFTECYSKILQDPERHKELLNNLTFRKTFERIQGRWDGVLSERTVTEIANLNPEITGKGDYLKYEVDQMISLLLSAATDNAKELILAKINANPDFAKIFFYGLILGFNLNDLAAFMTSNAVNLIDSLSKPNMFDKRLRKISVNEVLNLLLYNDPYNLFIKFMPQHWAKNLSKAIGKIPDLKNAGIESLSDVWKAILEGKIILTVRGKKLLTFETLLEICDGTVVSDDAGGTFYNNLNTSEDLQRLDKYIEYLVKKIRNSGMYDMSEVNEDLKEFLKLWEGSNELTRLTNCYLLTNQGLPTTLDKYQNKLASIKKSIADRESEIKFSEELKLSDLKNSNWNKEDITKLENVIKTINPQLDGTYIQKMVLKIIENNIIGNFNETKWLIDDDYKLLIIDYYNCIKSTFNIFHFLKIHPQYNANMKLMGVSDVMVGLTNLKTKLTFAIQQKMMDEKYTMWDSKKGKSLQRAIDLILIRNFLSSENIELELNSDWKILNEHWEEKEITPDILNLKTGFDFSNFKYVFEKHILPDLKDGKLKVLTKDAEGKETEISVKDNDFIKGIKIAIDHNRPYVSLGIDVSKRTVSESTNVEYNKYQLAFQRLSSYKCNLLKINGESATLEDLFVLYNFIVNLNQYGSDKLTSMFKSIVTKNNENSLYYKYWNYVGGEDILAFKKDQSEVEKVQENVMVGMAQKASKASLKYLDSGYYRVTEKGVVTLYKVAGRDYKEVAMYTVNDFGEPAILDEDLKVMVTQYACLFNADDIKSINCGKLKTDNPKVLFKALQNLMNTNKLIITMKC